MKDFTHDVFSLLYTYPLYQPVATLPGILPNADSLNIIVVGNDFSKRTPAVSFIDAVLSAGQMRPKIIVNVYSKESENDYFDYMSSRQGLEHFIQVKLNGETQTSGISDWGDLHFHALSEGVLLGRETHFVFLDSCSDDGNEKLALDLETNYHVFIAYIKEEQIWIRYNGHSYPLSIDSCSNQHLETIAFNTHLKWSSLIESNTSEIEEDFKKPYNFKSSMSFALSIKYKLWHIGIDIESPDEAAEQFSKKAKGYKHLLGVLEQRRWVMEKVLDGWTSSYQRGCAEKNKESFDSMVQRGSIKDTIAKTHPCILACTEKAPLSKDDRWKLLDEWDIPSDKDQELDDLDLMSVEMHRYMRAKRLEIRDNFKKESSDGEHPISVLKSQITANHTKARIALHELIFCIENILDGSYAYAKQYSSFERRFRLAVNDEMRIQSADKFAIYDQLAKLKKQLFPAIEANLYHDYKLNNLHLVKEIPFILTYRNRIRMAITLNVPETPAEINDVVLNNVASVVSIKPGYLLYLFQVTKRTRLDLAIRILQAASSYLKRNGITSPISVAVAYDGNVSTQILTGFLNELYDLKYKGIISSFTTNNINNQLKKVSLFFVELLAKEDIMLLDCSIPPIVSPYMFMDMIELLNNNAGNNGTQIGQFEFDIDEKRFFNRKYCEWLKYIHDDAYLQIDDMFILTGGSKRLPHYPQYGDHNKYIELWNIYTGRTWGVEKEKSISYWNKLTGELQNQMEKSPASQISINELRKNINKKYDNPVDEDSFNRLIDALLREGFLDVGTTHDTVKVPERYRGILTKEGEILEVYCYFEIFKKGYFDDIVCGYEFNWDNDAFTGHPDSGPIIHNEIDLILTKGFRSVMIECKGRDKLDQDFYHKLNSLTDMFGIHSQKVLIAALYSNNEHTRRDNNTLIHRGNLMNIITISDFDDIEHIGDTLVKLMEQKT